MWIGADTALFPGPTAEFGFKLLEQRFSHNGVKKSMEIIFMVMSIIHVFAAANVRSER